MWDFTTALPLRPRSRWESLAARDAMAAAGKAVAVLGERAGQKKERTELAETSFYSDKLDMLLAATSRSFAS